MTPIIHPHWHTTDAREVSVPVRTGNMGPKSRYAVRHPAAIVGILLVIGLGMVFVEGIHELRGQLSTSPVTVRIGAAGLSPKTIFVVPGQTITWRNEQDVPHILTSDTLPVEGGFLYTPHILPGKNFSIRIAPDAAPGDFTYVSLTSEDMSGTVTIESGPAIPSPMHPLAPPALTTTIPPSIPSPLNNGPSRPLAPLASLPRNPYALDAAPTSSPVISPSSPLPYPIAPTSPRPLAATVRPFAQPQTGPRGMGAAIVVSILLMTGLCRRLMKESRM